MGGKSSRTQLYRPDFFSTFPKKYKFLSEVNDPHYGILHTYQHKKENSFVMSKSLTKTDKIGLKNLNSEIMKRKRMKHKNLIEVLSSRSSGEEMFCGDLNKVTVYYEFFGHDLDKEIRKREKTNDYFSEPELWYLLESLVSVGYFLQQNKISISYIHPSKIFLDNDGLIKLIDLPLLFVEMTPYTRVLSGGKSDCFFSPLLLNNLKNRTLIPKHNCFKSDVFSVGLTLLSAANLISGAGTKFYCNKFGLNINEINETLEIVSSKYSNLLYNVLVEILNLDENSRPDFQDLQELMRENKGENRENQVIEDRYSAGGSNESPVGRMERTDLKSVINSNGNNKENLNQPSFVFPVQTTSYIQSQSPILSHNRRSRSQSPIINCNLDRCSSPPHLIQSNFISEHSRIKKGLPLNLVNIPQQVIYSNIIMSSDQRKINVADFQSENHQKTKIQPILPSSPINLDVNYFSSPNITKPIEIIAQASSAISYSSENNQNNFFYFRTNATPTKNIDEVNFMSIPNEEDCPSSKIESNPYKILKNELMLRASVSKSIHSQKKEHNQSMDYNSLFSPIKSHYQESISKEMEKFEKYERNFLEIRNGLLEMEEKIEEALKKSKNKIFSSDSNSS